MFSYVIAHVVVHVADSRMGSHPSHAAWVPSLHLHAPPEANSAVLALHAAYYAEADSTPQPDKSVWATYAMHEWSLAGPLPPVRARSKRQKRGVRLRHRFDGLARDVVPRYAHPTIPTAPSELHHLLAAMATISGD